MTSRPGHQSDRGQILVQYKGQGAVERRYHDFKGPLAVTPLFVQHNHRTAALIQLICLALLVFGLIERQARRALGPDQTMAGRYPDNRRVRSTGQMILYHLAELTLQRPRHRLAHHPDHPWSPTPPPRRRSHPNPLATDLKWRPAKSGPEPLHR
ncbi:hypothetical protein AB0I54_46270 [Streptomyces sp. NPDC050625]|uniref:hypothetical protein n=1 Tax=Streptomyces sp. NPDC050625 TaxID=3154629 RepID=UPI0034308DAF